MSNDRFNRLQQLFDQALEMAKDDREAWLTAQCGDDEALLSEVRALLAEDDREHDPLEAGLLAHVNPADLRSDDEQQPSRLAAYAYLIK